jgi:hypothetical protein
MKMIERHTSCREEQNFFDRFGKHVAEVEEEIDAMIFLQGDLLNKKILEFPRKVVSIYADTYTSHWDIEILKQIRTVQTEKITTDTNICTDIIIPKFTITKIWVNQNNYIVAAIDECGNLFFCDFIHN